MKRRSHHVEASIEEIRAISGENIASKHLSSAEASEVLDDLLQIIDTTSRPAPVVVWAVSKSADDRIIARLRRLLERTLADEGAEDIAREVLQGLMLFSGGEAEVVIRKVAKFGYGEIRSSAVGYLHRHSRHL